MGPGELGVKAADGPDYHKSQSAGVRWCTRFNAGCQGFEDRLVCLEVAVPILNQQVFTSGKDTVIGDESLLSGQHRYL